MRLPKTVQISGKTYIVKKNDKHWGASCRTGSQEIRVGTKKDQSAHRIVGNFIHEILESVTMERDLRYQAADDEFIFVMTHKQFGCFAEDVTAAIRPMMKD